METTNIILHSLIYLVFFLSVWAAKNGKFNRLINDGGALTENLLSLILFHLSGIFLLGYIPLFFIHSEVDKIIFSYRLPHSFFIFCYILIFVFLLFFSIRQAKKDYLDRIEKSANHICFSIDLLTSYFAFRIFFLAVYELWFRGLLLFDCISDFGLPAAVAINLVLYVLVHIFNGRKEMLACIPFGLLVCALSIVFNAVWPAILLHAGFSLFYEITFYKLHSNKIKTVSS
ncbi:CPBP family intramembrane glutamic endopeptidase [Flavobacterium sp. H122]|uniref:CPBP family intramembrane glutamic endopeptidase n=1 Tax=Flavobacterium sp. H122 TaxID=2529860 RepID=UPI0010A9AA3B|nr:CPBP family intramembrane glutamic endopeptidase [Flavobacterium sp. H122]